MIVQEKHVSPSNLKHGVKPNETHKAKKRQCHSSFFVCLYRVKAKVYLAHIQTIMGGRLMLNFRWGVSSCFIELTVRMVLIATIHIYMPVPRIRQPMDL